ncbi:hypothetical protein ACH4NS_05960 [Streptomyces mutabilis]|uniref:hypothetical protein n=1 Tax=Streptomyces mutabilis TaxID=67332 RepID=UPI0037A4A9C7
MQVALSGHGTLGGPGPVRRPDIARRSPVVRRRASRRNPGRTALDRHLRRITGPGAVLAE